MVDFLATRKWDWQESEVLWKFQHGRNQEEVSENKVKCSKKNKTWSERELTTFAHLEAC